MIESINGVFASIVISLAMSFIPAAFAVFIVQERELKAKHLQFISGVSTFSYWLANYVWDIINFVVPGLLSCLLFAA